LAPTTRGDAGPASTARFAEPPLNVHIYTDIDTLFGRAARLWMDVLLEAGHEAELIDLGAATDQPLPDVGPCDINLLITGIYAMQRFSAFGLPRHGKHLLWMFDPLTKNEKATVHRPKTELFDALAPQLHAVMAMDASIERYIASHFPTLPVFRLPYLVAEKHIRAPLPESLRTRGAVMLGSETPGRRDMEARFLAAVPPTDVAFIWRGMWGSARDTCRAEARVSLNIHADSHHAYFDQFRTFETWAVGTAVLSDMFEGAGEFGIEPGVHLAMTSPQDMPSALNALLKDVAQREALTRAAQALLRERFSPASWRDRMLSMVESLA
jgi:Glycosyl transferases group 1